MRPVLGIAPPHDRSQADQTPLGEAISIGNVALVAYVALVFFANFVNQSLGLPGVSVSLIPLSLLCLLGLIRLGHSGLTLRALLGLALASTFLHVAATHGLQGTSDQLRLAVYSVAGILAGGGLVQVSASTLMRTLIAVSGIFTLTGMTAWGLNVATGRATTLSLYHELVFAKQDYTLIFTCVAGLLLYESYLWVHHELPRRRRVTYYLAVLLVGVLLLNLKSVLVALAGGYVLLVALRVIRFRYLVSAVAVGLVTIGLLASGLLPAVLVPANLQPFVLYATGQEVDEDEGRYLDSLAMRQEILNENLRALAATPRAALFGLGESAVAERNAPFVSPFTGRSYDLPSALESGLLWLLVMGGVVGFVGALAFLTLPLLTTARALRRDPLNRELALFLSVGCALLASNLLQDNTNSLVWVWFGILWTRRFAENRTAPLDEGHTAPDAVGYGPRRLQERSVSR